VVTAFLLPGKAAGFIDSNEKEKGQESEDSYGCNRISVSQTNTHTHTRASASTAAGLSHSFITINRLCLRF